MFQLEDRISLKSGFLFKNFHENLFYEKWNLIKNKIYSKSYLRPIRINYFEKSHHMVFVEFLTNFEQITWQRKFFVWRTDAFRSSFRVWQTHLTREFQAIKSLSFIILETFWNLNENFLIVNPFNSLRDTSLGDYPALIGLYL